LVREAEKKELFQMTKKNSGFKEGDRVVPCPQVMKCPNKSGKLMSRTGLSAEQLQQEPMHITETSGDGQLKIKHQRLGQPFTVHSKFMVRHAAATQLT
jgi:hypothetical protein